MIQHFRQGQDVRLAGDQLNQVVDACNAFLQMTGGGLAQVQHTAYGCTVSVDADDIMQYAGAGSGAASAVSSPSIYWAKAQAKWHNAANNSSYVSAKVCNDKDGTGETGTAFAVYLPRAAGTDPNVRSGNVVGYVVDSNGKKIAITDVSDDPIGTVKMWNLSASTIRGGWRKLPYTDYATKRKYPRAATADGEVGDSTGAESHNHTVGYTTGFNVARGGSDALVAGISSGSATTSTENLTPLSFGIYFIERYE